MCTLEVYFIVVGRGEFKGEASGQMPLPPENLLMNDLLGRRKVTNKNKGLPFPEGGSGFAAGGGNGGILKGAAFRNLSRLDFHITKLTDKISCSTPERSSMTVHSDSPKIIILIYESVLQITFFTMCHF